MDRSGQKISSLWGWGGGLFCHKNQSCLKSSEMDRSEVQNFPHFGGGVFSATKTKVARNRPQRIDPKSKIFLTLGVEGGFSATKTKVARNHPKRIDPKSKIFLTLGGAFLPQKPKLLEIVQNG